MTTKDSVYIALFAALMAILGLIPKLQLAGAVPITAQSLGVMLAGGILGARRGGLSLLLFIVLVLAGLPLLAGGRGGLALLAGPSGGFIIGFPLAAFATGWLVERFWPRLNLALALVASVLGGIVVLYMFGMPYMKVVTGMEWNSATVALLPFIPGDLIKAVIAAVVIIAIKQSYPLISRSAE